MKRTCLLFTIFGFLAFSWGFSVNSYALTSYDCNIKASIDITDATNPKILESINIVNKSDKFIINELNFKYPYNISNAEAYIGNDKLDIKEDSNSINLNLFRFFLIPNASKEILIKYNSLDLIKFRGGVTSFYLPEFEYCENKNVIYEIALPIKTSDLAYINVGNFEVISENQIKFEHNKDVYLSWGEPSSYIVNADLKLDYGNYIPIPSSNFSKTNTFEIPSSTSFFKDRFDNEFLNTTAGLDYLSSYSISVTPQKDLLGKYVGLSGFNDYSDSFKLSEYPSIREVYESVLNSFDPVLKRGSSSIKSIEEILKQEEQEASEYSYTFLNLLERNGYKAQMYYGLLQLPISEEIIWHYWVGVYDESSGEVVEYDPFIEDMMGYDSFGKVTNHRYIWGIYNIDIKFLPEAIHNIVNSKNLITYTDSTDGGKVKGASLLLSAFLNKPNDLSKKTELVIKNEGSEVVYVSKILLNGYYDITGSHSNIGVLPKTAKIITFDKDIPSDVLVKNLGVVNAQIEFINDSGSNILETNDVKINAYIIYIVFFVFLYGFIAGTTFFITRNFTYFKKLFFPNFRK